MYNNLHFLATIAFGCCLFYCYFAHLLVAHLLCIQNNVPNNFLHFCFYFMWIRSFNSLVYDHWSLSIVRRREKGNMHCEKENMHCEKENMLCKKADMHCKKESPINVRQFTYCSPERKQQHRRKQKKKINVFIFFSLLLTLLFIYDDFSMILWFFIFSCVHVWCTFLFTWATV